MKLLFNQEKSAEIADILGFVDKDFRVEKIKSQLYTASREVQKLIGRETYDYLYALYSKPTEGEGTITDDQAFLLRAARYPIALDAYRNYAPSGDISHTANGRKMRNEDNQTAAWEWMVNRNDEALEKQYYKALDTLLEILDETNPEVRPLVGEIPALKWKGTAAYLETHKLYVRTTADFDDYFPINSRLLLTKLQPGLSQCERLNIVPRIGKERNLVLKTALQSSAVDLEPNDQLLELIKEACVFHALAWGIRRLRVSLLPEGILQRYSGERVNSRNTKVPEKMEAELAAQSFEADAEKVLKQIEIEIKALNATETTTTEFTTDPNFGFDDDDNFVST